MTFSIRTYGFHIFSIAPINNQSVSGRAFSKRKSNKYAMER